MKSTLSAVLGFLRKPLNQLAVAGIGGAIWTVLQGTTSWEVAAPGIAAAIFVLIMPDNSIGKADVTNLVVDAIKLYDDITGKEAQARQAPVAPPASVPTPPASTPVG